MSESRLSGTTVGGHELQSGHDVVWGILSSDHHVRNLELGPPRDGDWAPTGVWGGWGPGAAQSWASSGQTQWGRLLVVVMVVDIVAGKGTGGNGWPGRPVQAAVGGRNDPNCRVGAPSNTQRRRGAEGGFGCLPRIGARVGALLEFFLLSTLTFWVGAQVEVSWSCSNTTKSQRTNGPS
jgi:hypothetical protein